MALYPFALALWCSPTRVKDLRKFRPIRVLGQTYGVADRRRKTFVRRFCPDRAWPSLPLLPNPITTPGTEGTEDSTDESEDDQSPP